MQIKKEKVEKPFTMVSQVACWDERLPIESLGMLTALLSFGDDWDYSDNGLKSVHNGNVRKAKAKLFELGYLIEVQNRLGNGKMGEVIMYIEPLPYQMTNKQKKNLKDSLKGEYEEWVQNYYNGREKRYAGKRIVEIGKKKNKRIEKKEDVENIVENTNDIDKKDVEKIRREENRYMENRNAENRNTENRYTGKNNNIKKRYKKEIDKEWEPLTFEEQKRLRDQYGQEIFQDAYDSFKDYHYPKEQSYSIVDSWCQERVRKKEKARNRALKRGKFNNFHQREYDAEEYERLLLTTDVGEA